MASDAISNSFRLIKEGNGDNNDLQQLYEYMGCSDIQKPITINRTNRCPPAITHHTPTKSVTNSISSLSCKRLEIIVERTISPSKKTIDTMVKTRKNLFQNCDIKVLRINLVLEQFPFLFVEAPIQQKEPFFSIVYCLSANANNMQYQPNRIILSPDFDYYYYTRIPNLVCKYVKISNHEPCVPPNLEIIKKEIGSLL